MPRFLFQCAVTHAEGSQQFFVDAKSEADALEQFRTKGGTMYSSECEVTSLGEPESLGEIDDDDYGDFEKGEG